MRTTSPTALTTSGEVRGERIGRVHRFLGIPYAADPVGTARLRPPAKPAAWEGVRDCVTPSPAPPQGGDLLLEEVVGCERVHTDEAGSLTVNVFTPAASGRRPVMVWIHGGAYVQGCGLQVWTDGARIAERYDMVVVSLNYRLGALGWLYLPQLLGPDYAGSANLGLQDQIAALAWVRDNIAHFGGDPDAVTVFGESAGGGSVAMLLGAPAARPLFHRAVLQSPPPDAIRTPDQAARIADEFAQVLRELAADTAATAAVSDGAVSGAAVSDGAVSDGAALDGAALDGVPPDSVADPAHADVRTAPLALLLAAQEELVRRYPVGQIPFTPVVDGTVLPLPPAQALRNGSCAHIPVLAGTNEHEGRLFTGLGPPARPEAFDAALAAAFPEPERAARARALYEAYEGGPAGGCEAYRGGPAAGSEAYRAAPAAGSEGAATANDLLAALITDQLFRAPTDALLDAHTAGGGRAWSYLFRWPTPALGGGLGSAHTLDIPYVFDALHAPGLAALLGDAPPQRLADAMSGAWAHFARHGYPAHELLPDWPEFTPDTRPTMILDSEPRLTRDPLSDRRAMWNGDDS
ncbi:carboxylesterase family protein [Streptomyces sp. E11-3]|uniref:carboxylesterase/lipase family protein n=1 Tax=Streptomyces sp. E11-3 TaxID=3110112 RepID=UPI003980E769